MGGPDASEVDLAGAIEPGSLEDATRALASIVAGMLERRTGSRAAAVEALPRAIRSVVAARRRLKGGAVRARILKILHEKTPGSAADGVRAGLPGVAGGATAARGLLASGAEGVEGVEELVLVAVEGLSCREAGSVTGDPAAVVERRAALAFAMIAEALAPS